MMQFYLQSHHLHHEAAMLILLQFLFKELREPLLRHQTHVVTLRHADPNNQRRVTTLSNQSVQSENGV